MEQTIKEEIEQVIQNNEVNNSAFLELPDCIIALIFDEYLRDFEIDPVIPLLICKKIFYIISECYFLGHLTRSYQGNNFKTNLTINYRNFKARCERDEQSETYRRTTYFHYDDTNLIKWKSKLDVRDNLNIHFDRTWTMRNNFKSMSKILVIYHKSKRISKNAFEDLLEQLRSKLRLNLLNEDYVYAMYDHMIIIIIKNQYYLKKNRNSKITVPIRLFKQRYEKNIQTYLKHKKPMITGRNIDYTGTKELQTINLSQSGKYFEHILDYGKKLLHLIGPKLTRELFDAITRIINPTLHVPCISRLITFSDNSELAEIFEKSVRNLSETGYDISSTEKIFPPPIEMLDNGHIKSYKDIFNKMTNSYLCKCDFYKYDENIILASVEKLWGRFHARCYGCFNLIKLRGRYSFSETKINKVHYFFCSLPLCVECFNYAKSYEFSKYEGLVTLESGLKMLPDGNYVFSENQDLIRFKSGLLIKKEELCNCKGHVYSKGMRDSGYTDDDMANDTEEIINEEDEPRHEFSF